MILRVTAKLGKKIGFMPGKTLPSDPNPFADWSAALFTADRVQYVLLTNTASLYSMVMYGRGMSNDDVFLDRVTDYMGEFLRDHGHEFIHRRLVMPAMGVITFSRALNRRVTGSMNDLIFQAKFHLSREEISPWDVSVRLNDVPMSYLSYEKAESRFARMTIEQPTTGRNF
jgi:hypothetical protein